MEENEEQEDTEEQDEEKMKTSDEVLYKCFLFFQQKRLQMTVYDSPLFSHREQQDKKSQLTRRCRPSSITSSQTNSSHLTMPEVRLCTKTLTSHHFYGKYIKHLLFFYPSQRKIRVMSSHRLWRPKEKQ